MSDLEPITQEETAWANGDLEPVTRKEQYLNRLTGEEQDIPDEPITRTEQYLAKLCGEEIEIPSSPITREETYLAYLNGENVTLPEPITRLEQFMAVAAEKSETKPTPLTREELYWDKYQGGEVLKDFPGLPASIVTVTDALAKPLDSLKVAITPVQAGSGDPSPDNIRPISGWTGCNVVVSPTTDAEDGQDYPITFPTEAGTVYGGTLDVVNGVLTVDRGMVTLNGSEDWQLFKSTEVNQLYISMINVESSIDAITTICDRYKSISIGNRYSNYNTCYTGRNSICFNINNTTVAEWKASLQTNNIQLVYKLTTPQTYQLTPTEVQMLLGTNNIWADTGDILEGKYYGKRSSATRAMMNTLRSAGEITEITPEEPEETEENADER